MEINVSQQLKEPIGSVREYHIDADLKILDDEERSHVQGEVKFTRTNRGILVQGKLETRIYCDCSRCLKRYSCPLHIDLEEEYFPVIDVSTGTPLDIPDEPGSFTIDEHHILDLRESIRQNALLAIPMKPLCREDCRGLCPQCGTNRNENECNCNRETIDPRWAKLKSLNMKSKKAK